MREVWCRNSHSNLALNPEIYTSLSLSNMQFHTHSQSVIISFSSSSQKFLVVQCHKLSDLGRNLATWRRTDLLKLCPMGGSLVNNNACSQLKSKS